MTVILHTIITDITEWTFHNMQISQMFVKITALHSQLCMYNVQLSCYSIIQLIQHCFFLQIHDLITFGQQGDSIYGPQYLGSLFSSSFIHLLNLHCTECISAPPPPTFAFKKLYSGPCTIGSLATMANRYCITFTGHFITSVTRLQRLTLF